MKDGRDPVSDDESVYRRILNIQDYYDPSSVRPISLVAFRPTDSDTDGISVYRPACGATPLQVASGPNSKGYLVASLRVRDITNLDIEGLRPTVVPTPELNETVPGHASIPQLCVKLRDGADKKLYRILAQRLADLAGNCIVHRPVT